jgi:intein/homing endonuclease
MELKDKIYFGEPIEDRFYNGFSEKETVVLRYNGKVGVFTIRNFFTLMDPAERLVAKEEDIWIKDMLEEKPAEVLGKNGFEKVLQLVRRATFEPLFVIKTESGKTTIVGASHRIPVMRDGEDVLVRAENIEEGDTVYVKEGDNLKTEKVVKKELEGKRHLSVYGMITESGGAIISGIFQKSY